MYIEDRLFSENTEETLYSVIMDEDEYSLYSEFCSLFSKDEDGIDGEDLAKAAAIAAGATGTGAAIGKALQHQGEKKLKGLIGKRALQGAGIGQAINLLDTLGQYKDESKDLKKKARQRYRRALRVDPQRTDNERRIVRYLKKQAKDNLIKDFKSGAVLNAVSLGGAGSIEGAIEKHLKEKKLKELVKKGGKTGLATGALASAGYLVHKASEKKKKD